MPCSWSSPACSSRSVPWSPTGSRPVTMASTSGSATSRTGPDALGTGLFLSCTIGAVTVVVLALLLSRNLRLVLTLVVVGRGHGPARRRPVQPHRPGRAAACRRSRHELAVGRVGGVAGGGDRGAAHRRALPRPSGAPVRARGAAPRAARCGARGGGARRHHPGCGRARVVDLGPREPRHRHARRPPRRCTRSSRPCRRSGSRSISSPSPTRRRGARRASWVAPRTVRPPSVVVIGRDGADARLVSKLWRSLLYRDAGPSIAVTRSAQLEHRAYMLLMAAKAGVPVSEVVIADLGRTRGHRAPRPAGPRRATALGARPRPPR